MTLSQMSDEGQKPFTSCVKPNGELFVRLTWFILTSNYCCKTAGWCLKLCLPWRHSCQPSECFLDVKLHVGLKNLQ
jgi:hypothetical protein